MTNDTRRDPRLTQILQDIAHGQGMTELEAQQAILDTMRSGRNRWAAFTTNELKHLLTGLAYAEHHASGPLRVEIIAELERRHP